VSRGGEALENCVLINFLFGKLCFDKLFVGNLCFDKLFFGNCVLINCVFDKLLFWKFAMTYTSPVICCTAILQSGPYAGICCSYPAKTFSVNDASPVCLAHYRHEIRRNNAVNRGFLRVSFPICKGIKRDGHQCRRHGSTVVNGLNYCKCHIPTSTPAVAVPVPGGSSLEGRGADLEINSNDDVCAICLSSLFSSDQCHHMIQANCGHMFHKECLTRWLENPYGDSCPTCRRRTNISRASPPVRRISMSRMNIDIY